MSGARIASSVRTVALGSRGRALRAPLTFTPNALARCKQLLSERPECNTLRIGVKTRGCNGLSYTLDYVPLPGAPQNTSPAAAAASSSAKATAPAKATATAPPKPAKPTLDIEVVQEGVRVLIDSKAQLSLLGSEVDFVESELGAEFVFRNPNVKGVCGCGESFNI